MHSGEGGASRSYDVLTMGRVGIDVYPLQVGRGLEDVDTFGKYVGGSATNVAVAAARLGRRVAVVTRTGDDPFGRFVHRALRGYGVDDRYVTAVHGRQTPLAFCEIFPPDDFPLYFYRQRAPDLEIATDELDLDAIRSAAVFWVTVTGLSREPSRSATLEALEARARRGITVLDLDYRPVFWASREQARAQVQRALPLVTVAVGNLDECDTAVGEPEPHAAAAALRAAGVDLAVVKQGPRGVLAVDGAGAVEVPPTPVEVVNGLGAGDAFGGALCHGLLEGWELERTIRFANAAGAIVASRLACSDAMPTPAEVEAFLQGRPAGTPSHISPRGTSDKAFPAGDPMPREGRAISDKLHLPAGSGAVGPYTLVVTPETAGWTYSALRVLDLSAGGSHTFSTGDEEMVVLPLEGGCMVECDGQRFEVRGRQGVFAGVTDLVYLPRDAEVGVTTAGGGRFALPSARCERRLPARYRAAEDVPVELRGAGSCSRRVVNFCSADDTFADKLIAVEVLTPGGNWSSYPPHKHDEQRPGESVLEEVYYFEVADGPGGPGMAYQRVYGTPDRPLDLLAEVRSGDVVLIPHGWHGPSMAAPGYDLYYLNVMAGPGDERAWLICDDPAHAWVRDTWKDEA